jgi:hypothetical protein
MLDAAPDLRVIATCREALSIPGETLHGVPTLALPPVDPPPTALGVVEYESARLFVERGRQVRPDFALSDADAPIVADLCRRLDGIPLAIELAAARLRVLGVKEIRAKLDDRFRLLTGGSRTALPRHQTLRATIQWSYDQLTDDEKKFLRALAAFTGGWTMETATAVVDDNADEFETLDLMTRLVEKSLAVVERADAGSRYRFLETVRQYALEELNAAGEGKATRDRHLKTFELLAQEAESGLLGPDQANWLAGSSPSTATSSPRSTGAPAPRTAPARGLAFAAAVSRFLVGPRLLRTRLDLAQDRARARHRGEADARARQGARARGRPRALPRRLRGGAPPDRGEPRDPPRRGRREGRGARVVGGRHRRDLPGRLRPRAHGDRGEPGALPQARQPPGRGDRAAQHRLHRGAPGAAGRGAPAVRRGARDHARGRRLRGRGAHALGGGACRPPRGGPAGARAMLAESLDRALELGAKREGAYALEAAAELARADGDPAGPPGCPAPRRRCGRPWARRWCRSRRASGRNSWPGSSPSSGPERTAAGAGGGRGLGFGEAVALAREGLPAGQ